MTRKNIIVAVVLFAIIVAGVLLLFWERVGQRTKSTAPNERLLIGLNPRAVERIRLRYEKRTLELVLLHGAWETTEGVSGSVRVKLLLKRLTELPAQRLSKGRRRQRGCTKTSSVAEITLWRRGDSNVLLRFCRLGRQMALTTSVRPGVFVASGKLLGLLRRELSQPHRPPVFRLDPQKLASVDLKLGTGRTLLVQRKTGWSVEQGDSLAPANAASIGQMLRSLQALRITARLGKGREVLVKHGLAQSTSHIRIDDGTRQTLRLGKPCPRPKVGTLAALGESVLCVTFNEADFKGPYISRRLFALSTDEIKAVSVTRRNRTLALVNRPGSGGWSLISPQTAKVDQAAATDFVSRLTAIQILAKQGPAPSIAGSVLAGTVLVTPLMGTAERVELWTPKQPNTAGLYARRSGGGRLLALDSRADQLLGANPVLLRSRAVCTAVPEAIQRWSKAYPTKVTEFANSEGGTWQMVLLDGYKSLDQATGVGRRLDSYRPPSKGSDPAPVGILWRRPVVWVGQPDSLHLGPMLHALSSVHAVRFVSDSERTAYGFSRTSLRVDYVYKHDCSTDKDGKQHCQQSRCGLEFGHSLPKGRCYARRAGDKAVFVADAALCEAAKRPMASRRVVTIALHRFQTISIKQGGRSHRLVRDENGAWALAGSGRKLSQEATTTALLALAPMTADSVESYRVKGLGRPVLTVVLSAPRFPAAALRFYRPLGDEKAPTWFWLVRQDRPMRYRVPASTVTRLIDLLKKR